MPRRKLVHRKGGSISQVVKTSNLQQAPLVEASEIARRKAELRDMFRPMPGVIESSWYRVMRQTAVENILRDFSGSEDEFLQVRAELTSTLAKRLLADGRWVGLQPLYNMTDLSDGEKKSIEIDVEARRKELQAQFLSGDITPLGATRELMIFFTEAVRKMRVSKQQAVLREALGVRRGQIDEEDEDEEYEEPAFVPAPVGRVTRGALETVRAVTQPITRPVIGDTNTLFQRMAMRPIIMPTQRERAAMGNGTDWMGVAAGGGSTRARFQARFSIRRAK